MQLPRTQVITNVLKLYTEFEKPKSKYIGINTHCILLLYMCLTLTLKVFKNIYVCMYASLC